MSVRLKQVSLPASIPLASSNISTPSLNRLPATNLAVDQAIQAFKSLTRLELSILQGLLYIVTEFAGGGTLYSLVNQAKGPLPEDVIWRLFIQV